MSEFYFDSNNIVETINEDFVVLKHYGVNLIYSINLQMVNATNICNQFDFSYRHWKTCYNITTLMERFPEKFVDDFNNRIPRCRGTYIAEDLVNYVLSQMNPILGYTIINGYHENVELNLKEGYVYIVQPEEYKNTNIYKIGRSWKTKQRFQAYGKDTKIILIKKVEDMYTTEMNIRNELTEISKPIKGNEYFNIDLDEIIDVFNENTK